MTQRIDALSSLTKLTPYTSVESYSNSVSVHDGNFDNFVSSAFNKISDTTTQYKDAINTMTNAANFSSDPQALVMLQSYLGEYNNYVSLVSTLARKGVAMIETLEKSQ